MCSHSVWCLHARGDEDPSRDGDARTRRYACRDSSHVKWRGVAPKPLPQSHQDEAASVNSATRGTIKTTATAHLAAGQNASSSGPDRQKAELRFSTCSGHSKPRCFQQATESRAGVMPLEPEWSVVPRREFVPHQHVGAPALPHQRASEPLLARSTPPANLKVGSPLPAQGTQPCPACSS